MPYPQKDPVKRAISLRFGEYIRSKRKEIGIPTRKLAKTFGCSPRYLNDIELGLATPPRIPLLYAIAEVLAQDVDEVFFAAGKIEPSLVIKLLNRLDLVKVLREAP